MKKLLVVALLFTVTLCGAIELTLSEKSVLAETQSFRSRIIQALNSKANFWRTATPTNLKMQKQKAYANLFLLGGQNATDVHAITRFWLANYNTTSPVLDSNNQPIDSEILESAGLDVVFDALAGVVAGDENLPVNP